MKISGVKIPAGVTITAPELEPTQLPVEFVRAGNQNDSIEEGEIALAVVGGATAPVGMISGFSPFMPYFTNTGNNKFYGNIGIKKTPGSWSSYMPSSATTFCVAIFRNVDPNWNPTSSRVTLGVQNFSMNAQNYQAQDLPLTGNELNVIFAGCNRDRRADLTLSGAGVDEQYFETGAYNSNGSVAIAGHRPAAGDTAWPGASVTTGSGWSLGAGVGHQLLLRPSN